ncbi:MAG: phosphoribosylanthranilate isomerase [Chloroflexota bacterium]
MVRVKICGVTTLEDARAATEAGADLLGLNFYKKSPRYITPEAARELCDGLRATLTTPMPRLVGVFVNAVVSDIIATLSEVGLDAAQLSGDESDSIMKELKGRAYKAIQPMNAAMAKDDITYYAPYFPQDEHLPSLLLDAYHPTLRGGTGSSAAADVVQAVKAGVPRLMLAGGLDPENVGAQVAQFQPWGVDVASGVEDDTPGVKNADKVRAFIQAARTASKA